MFPPFLFPFLRPVPAAPDPRGGILALSAPPWSAPSRRTEDMSAEGQLGIFLDRYLYSRLEEAGRIRSFRRVRDRSGQLRGTDVILTAPEGGALRLDEKAQLYYLNRDLPTFAFELSFLLQGKEVPGWLPPARSPKRVRLKPRRYLADPSLAVAVLGMSPDSLLADWQTFGLVFENLCMRDLMVYADPSRAPRTSPCATIAMTPASRRTRSSSSPTGGGRRSRSRRARRRCPRG